MAGTISETTLHNTAIALLILTSIAIVARLLGGGLGQFKRLQVEDGWLVLCYALFVSVAVLYMYIVPAFFRVSNLAAGLIEPYPTAEDDSLFIQKGLFAASSCLWFCLWSAKFSLLCMYKKLMDKLPKYIMMWWALVAFTSLALVGCMVTLFEACSSMHAWFSVGLCYTQRDIVHAAISLWYAYAVDVITDLLIMALPLRLVIGLQMPLSRKLSIATLFCLGFVLIIMSTIRATQISKDTAQPTVPWLALWGTIESATSVIIASGPGLYRIIKMHSKRKDYYGDQVSSKTPRANTRNTRKSYGRTVDDEVDTKPYPLTTISRAEPSSSQEGLVYTDGGERGIMVTTGFHIARSEDASQKST